jgi:hypothetical protein
MISFGADLSNAEATSSFMDFSFLHDSPRRGGFEFTPTRAGANNMAVG